MAPPEYGIDFVDGDLAASAQLEGYRARDQGDRNLSQTRIALAAVIPRRADPVAPTADRGGAVAVPDLDAEEGVGPPVTVDLGAINAAFTLPSGDLPPVEDGATIQLPDIMMPESLKFYDQDMVAASITHSPTIAQSGVVSPFGATTWSVFNITGQTVTAASGAFTVRFTLENPITYNVASPKTSIASADDPALTNANFAQAAADLSPRMDVQNGKPRRTTFWARDLTLRHERFHSDERSRLNQAGAAQAQTWLSGQTAANVAEVQALIAQVPGRVITASQAAVGTLDEKESRAYGDGAAIYRARADAINARGALGPDGGGYPG
jgi:hypothetical protein